MTELTEVTDWDRITAESHDHPVFVFKHSTACPVSHSAYARVTAHWKDRDDLPPVYLIKVIQSRPLSNHVAAETGVTHQSPQILLIRDGNAAWNASHGAVTGDAIDDAV